MSDDTSNAGSSEGSRGISSVSTKVNGRKYRFDLNTGQVLGGPRAVLGKFVSGEQLADLIAVDDSRAHLYLAESEAEVRLAEAEYRLARAKEHQMLTPEVGQVVEYGDAQYRVLEVHADHVLAETIGPGSERWVHEGRSVPAKFSLPRPRFDKLAEPFEPIMAEAENPYSQYQTAPGEGRFEINDDDLNKLVQERVDQILETKMDEVVERVATRLASTLDAEGAESEGDASVSS